MKRKKWVNKVIALLLAAIMIVPSSLGTVAYAQEPEVSSEQTQTIQNADEDISEANEQETVDASQKEQEKKETQETQDTESKETQKEDSYEVKLSKADNGLLSFPISEDDLVKADVENSTQSILDASEEDVEYESKDSYEENTEVKVQTSADYGYELDKVELEDKSGEVLQELSVDEEGIATFTMPEENVKVAATFKEIPESVIEDAEIDLQTTASDYEIATRAAGMKSIYLNVPGNKIWYGRYNTRYYTTNEGQVAYCMNPLLKTPGAGWYTGSLISDGSSRKAFYYAYGGPGYSQFVNRYGWIWNGVRDLEYAYSHVILSYTYAKYALHNNSQANYAFYGLPNSTKKHLINKANQMQAMGGIPSGYAVYYFNTSYNHQPMAFQVNNVATLSLRKSSSNTDITNGNSCYSLANAKYGIYSNAACTSQVSTFTTNANGTSNSINLEPGTYYVKEISAPEGYYIDNTVKTVSLSSGENKVVSFTDKPMDDPAAIVIQKKDKYTGNTIKGKKTYIAGLHLFFLLILITALFIFTVWLQDTEKKIPVTYSGKLQGKSTFKGVSTNTIPIKLCPGGVVPIIFASSLISFPILIAQIAGAKRNAVLKLLNSGYWFNTSKPWYTFGALIYLVLIFAFSYFYTEITMNPEEIANNIKKSGGNIAGIRAGSSTAEYLRKQMKYLIAIGSFCLCIIAIIPFIVSGLTGLSRLSFFGTSIIITVSVILETKKLILSKTQENYYMNRVKKGGLFRG